MAKLSLEVVAVESHQWVHRRGHIKSIKARQMLNSNHRWPQASTISTWNHRTYKFLTRVQELSSNKEKSGRNHQNLSRVETVAWLKPIETAWGCQ